MDHGDRSSTHNMKTDYKQGDHEHAGLERAFKVKHDYNNEDDYGDENVVL